MGTSVIIPSYNTCDTLLRCLRTVADAAEVCVVDNASADGTAAAVRDGFPQVRLIALPENQGFSAAVNHGVRAVGGDILLLLNPDTELPEGAVARMTEALRRRPHAGAVGFRQIDAAGNFQLAAGPTPTLVNEALRCLVQRQMDHNRRWVGRVVDWALSRPRVVPWVAASSLIVERRAFERVGGFDEGFFLYFEDIDFCLRLAASVGPIYYDPTVTVLHHRGRSAATAPSLAQRAYRQSQMRFWRKHRGPWAQRTVAMYLRTCKRASL